MSSFLLVLSNSLYLKALSMARFHPYGLTYELWKFPKEISLHVGKHKKSKYLEFQKMLEEDLIFTTAIHDEACMGQALFLM